MNRSKSIRSKAEIVAYNTNLSKVSAQAEVDEILVDIMEKKFENLTREWILKSNMDTPNGYVEYKEPQSTPGQFVDTPKPVKVANTPKDDKGKLQVKNALSLTCKRNETIITCLMASMFLL